MKLAFRLILASMVLAPFAFAQLPQFSPFSADLQITTTRGPRDITGQVYVGSDHIRMNMDGGGHKTALITDFATRTTDILLVEQQMYIEQKAGQMAGRGPDIVTQDLKPYDPEHPCANQPDITCKKIGVEEASGRTCDHWQIRDKNGKVSDLWIDQALHFPVKVTTPDSTMLLTNIKEAQPDATLFEIPAGYQKMDISGMMGPGMQHPPQN